MIETELQEPAMQRLFSRAMLLAGASVLSLLTADPASAQTGIGTGQWYVGAEGGYSKLQDSAIRSGVGSGDIQSDDGWFAGGTIGRKSATGWRLELEGAYRQNDGVSVGGIGDGQVEQINAFVNLIKEFNSQGIFQPYVGIGGGYVYTKLDTQVGAVSLDENDNGWGAQGLAGIGFKLSDAVDLDIGYRYHWTNEPEFDISGGTTTLDDLERHEGVIGLRYKWGGSPGYQEAQYTPPPAEPTPQPPSVVVVEPTQPQPQTQCETRSTEVYFGFDSATVNTAGRQAVQSAMQAVQTGCEARFTVIGHADRTGSADYNQRLAERRARAVQTMLIDMGAPATQVRVAAAGETSPAVPTDDGVREPRNRRVQVQLNGTVNGPGAGGASGAPSGAVSSAYPGSPGTPGSITTSPGYVTSPGYAATETPSGSAGASPNSYQPGSAGAQSPAAPWNSWGGGTTGAAGGADSSFRQSDPAAAGASTPQPTTTP